MFDKMLKGLACLFLSGCAAQIDNESNAADREQLTVVQQQQIASVDSPTLGAFCSQEFRLEHMIPVGGGAQVHVIERFSGRSILRFPRRALLMLPATLGTNEWYDADIDNDPSYNALSQAASRGFFGVAMSFQGSGESSMPDGRTVTMDRFLSDAGDVVEWIRASRGVPKVDVTGLSIGASAAWALGGTKSPIDRHHINRVVIFAAIYKTLTPIVAASYTPQFKASLLNAPGGYITTTPATYAAVFNGLSPSVLAWANATLPGAYPVGPTLEVFNLPFADAQPGRAPLLQVWGTSSPSAPFSDVEQFEDEYGGPYERIIYPGIGQVLFEPSRHDFWNATEAFLNEGSLDLDLCELLAPDA